METQLKITFQNLDRSEAVEARIRERVARLQRRYDRITSCAVVVAAPHGRHHKGNLYSCAIDIGVPGAEIVANRDPGKDHAHEDINVAIRDAFDAAERRLEDAVRKMRGDIKRHEAPPEGRIRAMSPDSGFIAAADGQEIYFHKNSVIGDYEKLQIGDVVRFTVHEGEGARGAQASTVTPLAHEHPRPDRR